MSDQQGSEATKGDGKLGAKGAGKHALYDPHVLFVIGLDGGTLGLDASEEQRIAALPEWEQPAALAPYKLAWLRDQFAGNDHALGMIEALIDDRATQPLDPGFVASCANGVAEPVIASHLGALKDGTPCVAMVEGRQRCRSLRVVNKDRAAEDPPLPPFSLLTVVKTYASPKKAREVKIVTANHVALSPLQRARRAKELLDDGVAPVDVAPLVGLTSKSSLKQLLELLDRDTSVQEAVSTGTVSAAAAREMKHLSAGEQRERVQKITASGARGKRAVEVAKTGNATAPETTAPARSIVEGVTKKCGASSDPLLVVVGRALSWAFAGDEAGIDKVPGLRALITEETTRHHGLALSETERARLQQKVDALGGPESAADKLGLNKMTLARALSGLKVKTRVRGVLVKVIEADEEKRAA